MNVLTNEVKITINYYSIFEDFKVLSKNIEYKNYQERGKFIKEFKIITNPIAYTIYENNILYLQQRDDVIIDNESKKLPKFKFEKIPKYLIANLIFQLLTKELNFFETIEEPYKLFYVVKITKTLISTISFEIDKNNLLQAKGVAFVKYDTKKYKKPDKKEFYIQNGKTMALANIDNIKDNVYIKGNFPGKKISIEYFNKGYQRYPKTKSYFIALFLNDIKKYLSNYITIDCISNKMEIYNDYKSNYKKKETAMIISHLKEKIKELNIVNFTNQDMNILKTLLNTILIDSKVTESNTIKNNSYNLAIVYDKEYYKLKKQDDPYEKLKQIDPYCQAFIINGKKTNETTVEVLLKELQIKNDIKNKKITMSDNITLHKIYTIEVIKDKNIKYKLHKLVIKKDKTITYIQLEQGDEFEKYVNIYQNSNSTDEELEAIVEDFENNINIIYKTKKYPTADYTKLYSYYIDGDPSGVWNPVRQNDSIKKGQKSTFYLTESLHGVKYNIKNETTAYYSVGTYLGSQTFSKTAPFRKIVALEGRLLIRNILTSLDQFFVKNRDFTVAPYQLKYLKEYKSLKS